MNKRLPVNLLNTMNKVLTMTARHVQVTDKGAQELASRFLEAGSVIALPTDTVYGLACDATNASAINKLYQIKDRCIDKPLAICLGDVSDIKKWAHVEHIPFRLLDTLLPGPYTLILKSTNKILDKSLQLNGKVGIRIPDSTFICNLSQYLGNPLALTSANLSNEPSAVDVLGFKSIWNKIPVIFDDGKLDDRCEASTVIDLSEKGCFNVIRQGACYEDLLEILSEYNLKSKQ